jgi:hypothetical protein
VRNSHADAASASAAVRVVAQLGLDAAVVVEARCSLVAPTGKLSDTSRHCIFSATGHGSAG